MKVAKLIGGIVLILAAGVGLVLRVDPWPCVALATLGGVLVDPADVMAYVQRIRGNGAAPPHP